MYGAIAVVVTQIIIGISIAIALIGGVHWKDIREIIRKIKADRSGKNK
ncbi:MAG: hypothetical protein PHQ86_07245 [Dehalococcoidales bacterium]|nr:hypothetical protein [Dehalococcoidales bacterium]